MTKDRLSTNYAPKKENWETFPEADYKESEVDEWSKEERKDKLRNARVIIESFGVTEKRALPLTPGPSSRKMSKGDCLSDEKAKMMQDPNGTNNKDNYLSVLSGAKSSSSKKPPSTDSLPIKGQNKSVVGKVESPTKETKKLSPAKEKPIQLNGSTSNRQPQAAAVKNLLRGDI